MEEYIAISQLNDFIFCPYSIYLHNVYMAIDEDIYHATPQVTGKIAHRSVDSKSYSTHKNDIVSLPVFSEELGLMGKIDIYKQKERLLIERKYNLKRIYQGQIYQLWAQYFCMIEMGYSIESLAFYEISTNKKTIIPIPTEIDKAKFAEFLSQFRDFDPLAKINLNPQKCIHCIYSNLCDKNDLANVYS